MPRPSGDNAPTGLGPHTAEVLLSVVIVAYNSADVIGQTIQNVYAVGRSIDPEVIVVDNASSDDSYERALEAVRRGRVIRSRLNRGFGGGANIGLSAATGKYVLVMNDDVRPLPHTLQRLLEVVADESIGLAGPRMIDQDGVDSFAIRAHLPGPRDELARLIDLVRGVDSRGRYPEAHSPVDVGLLVCACVMAETAFLRSIGGFNDAFFMYGEDIDLCRRIRSFGRRVVTVPDVKAQHDRRVSPDRRYDQREFSARILNARDTYYRIWLRRPTRILLNLWRSIGPTDQPFRLRFHFRKAVWDGPGLAHRRRLDQLPDVSDKSTIDIEARYASGVTSSDGGAAGVRREAR